MIASHNKHLQLHNKRKPDRQQNHGLALHMLQLLQSDNGLLCHHFKSKIFVAVPGQLRAQDLIRSLLPDPDSINTSKSSEIYTQTELNPAAL